MMIKHEVNKEETEHMYLKKKKGGEMAVMKLVKQNFINTEIENGLESLKKKSYWS